MAVKELKFVNIEGMYGGNQYRFTHPRMYRGGCSTVAACHASICLAELKPEKSALSPLHGLNVTDEEFTDFAKEMFKYVYPQKRGIDSVQLFEEAYLNYVKTTGVEVLMHSLSGQAKFEDARDFIKNHIDNGITVQYLLLHHSNKEFSEIEWHWFTVTGYEENGDDFSIIYSTWAERRTADLKALWNIGVDEYGGLLAIM